MRWRRRRELPATAGKGFLAVAGRQADLPLREVFLYFRDLVATDIDWADRRKRRNRRRASVLRLTALCLTAASTVVLGIEAIPNRQWVALPMVALVTVLGGLEAFLSWRPMWVLMEETEYRFHRLREKIDFHLVVTPAADLTLDQLREFFAEQQNIWDDTSQRWLGFRTLDREPGQG
jgi:hypothetical protein